MEFGILGFRIRKTTQEIQIPQRKESGLQFPLTKTGIQYLESGIPGVDFSSQDLLGFAYNGAIPKSIS